MCHLECNVGKRKQTSTACKATGLGCEEDWESRPRSELGRVQGRCWGSHHQATAREGTAFLHEVLPAVVQRSTRQHPFLDQFLHYDALLRFLSSHTREGRPSMTVPKVICGIF